MSRPANTALMNGNKKWIAPVLNSVKGLRHAYRNASANNMAACDAAARELVALLRDPIARHALDTELSRRAAPGPVLATGAFRKDLVERETALGAWFGYSQREVQRYMNRARAAAKAASAAPDIGSTEQLARHLERLHGDVSLAMSQGRGPLSRWRAVRRARAEADDRLFSIGVIIADAGRRPLFDLSYAVGVMGLPHDEA